tara:strand:+ start:1970 stop:2359 length:390 start_codon:yes stop_codon:yes gene_type:complete
MSSISKKTLREFGFLIGFFFPILIGLILPKLFGHGFRIWTLGIGVPMLVLAKIKPTLLFYPYKLWMSLGFALGWINSRIILGIIFIFLLQPIALIMKLFKYDPLKNKKINKKTYRENVTNKSFDFTRIF